MSRKIELLPMQIPASDPEVIEYLRHLVRMAFKHKIEDLDISGVIRKSGSLTTLDYVWPPDIDEPPG